MLGQYALRLRSHDEDRHNAFRVSGVDSHRLETPKVLQITRGLWPDSSNPSADDYLAKDKITLCLHA